MTRPRLDPDAATFPLALPEVPFAASEDLARLWIAGLGSHASATRTLAGQGYLPPQALVGNTIYLVSCHFDIAGGVYWSEHVTLHRPVRIGERLSVAGSVLGTYWRDGRRYLVMASRTSDRDGRLVATSRSSGLLRYRRDETPPPDTEPPGNGEPAPDTDAAQRNPLREQLRELQVGEKFTAGPVLVTLDMMRALAGQDERNPIHTDEEAARQAGLAAPIAGGPHVLAFAMETVMAALGPDALMHGAAINVRWVAPVAAGTSIRPEASVLEVTHAGAELGVEILAGGRTAMVGRITIPL